MWLSLYRTSGWAAVLFACLGPVSLTFFLPAIQIRWKLRLAITPLLAIRSQQIFAHAMTAQLSCHVQNFVEITVLESRWEWNEISTEKPLVKRAPAMAIRRWKTEVLELYESHDLRSKDVCWNSEMLPLVLTAVWQRNLLVLQSATKIWELTNRYVAPNGGVMRTSILGLHRYWDMDQVIKNTLEICKVTHADPRSGQTSH